MGYLGWVCPLARTYSQHPFFETEETPLLGMELLQGSQLIVQVGGDVLIDGLDRIES